MSDVTECEGTWPEQNAVDAWVERHSIEADFKQLMELKRNVSEYRVVIQKELESQKIKLLPWWRKDKLGWPIETVKGRYVSNFIRIVMMNIRKLF